MKENKIITQEELDAFVKEHNSDLTSKCKINSIRTMTIFPLIQNVKE